jgi:hypothetical protein
MALVERYAWRTNHQILFLFFPLTHPNMGNKAVAQKVPLRKKTSPAIIPPTPDVPIRQSIPTSIPQANTMAEASANDVVPIITHVAGTEKVVLGRNSSGKETMAADATGVSK